MLSDFINLLTDVFNKGSTSNISKLFSVISYEYDKLQSTQDMIAEWRAIDNAQGSVLDEIGDEVNQLRGQATDDIYRILLKAKIFRGLSDGTLNSIIDALSRTLNCPPSSINIKTSIEDGDTEPAALIIALAPVTVLNNVQMPRSQFFDIIRQVVDGSVQIYWDLITDFNVGLSGSRSYGTSKIAYCGELGCGGGAQIFGTGKVTAANTSLGAVLIKGSHGYLIIPVVIDNGLGESSQASLSAGASSIKGTDTFDIIPIPENDSGQSDSSSIVSDPSLFVGTNSYAQCGAAVTGG